MGRIGIAIFIVLGLSFVAFAIDLSPTMSLSASPNPTESTAIITAVSVDVGDNAGIISIDIYEDGILILSRNCGLSTSCTAVKTVVHISQESHTYTAKATDKGGKSKTSSL